MQEVTNKRGKGKIAAVASCFPPNYATQEAITEMLLRLWPLSGKKADRLRQFHENVQVKGRYLSLPIEEYEKPAGFGARNDVWIETALNLGEATITELLGKSGLNAGEISLLATTSITGIAAPSLEARLMNRLPFSKTMKRMPFFGLGCVGGAAGIARLADYLAGHPEEAAILLSVELCSLTIQQEDTSIANMVSSGLFGDGAAAVLMVGEGHPLANGRHPSVIDTRSVFFPDTEHIMGWLVRDTGFKIVLSSDVSDVAGSRLKPEVEDFLRVYGLAIENITHWIAHPGGPKVIEALAAGLELPEDALELSRASLAQVGNISSTSVLLILEETLNRYQPEHGTYGLLMAMGPAFSAELVLLQW